MKKKSVDNVSEEDKTKLHKFISSKYKWDNVIKEDLTRTYPNHIMFDIEQDQEDTTSNQVATNAKAQRTLGALQRILRCYGLSNEKHLPLQEADKTMGKTKCVNRGSAAFRYTQGMNFIAGMFLCYMPEERAFYMLKTVMESPHYNMQGLFMDKTPIIPL